MLIFFLVFNTLTLIIIILITRPESLLRDVRRGWRCEVLKSCCNTRTHTHTNNFVSLLIKSLENLPPTSTQKTALTVLINNFLLPLVFKYVFFVFRLYFLCFNGLHPKISFLAILEVLYSAHICVFPYFLTLNILICLGSSNCLFSIVELRQFIFPFAFLTSSCLLLLLLPSQRGEK